MMRIVFSAALVSLVIGLGNAHAQAQAAAPTTSAPKSAVSKSCSDQANAKGLHGKERKKFRSECKHKAK
jgi:hypothetical protein